MLEKTENNIRRAYLWLNDKTFGFVRILRITIDRFGEANSTQAAAGMSYYAFFSLFPLLLFMVVGASYVLQVQSAYDYIMNQVFMVLPTAQAVIDANLQQVLQSRGAVGLISLVGFLWSSTSFFAILTRNINRANPNYKPRNFIEDRALALGMIGLLALLLGLSLLSNTLTNIIPQINLFFIGGKPLHETVVWRYLIKLIPVAITLMMFIGLYRFIPKKKIGWTGVLIAAPIATIGFQLATRLFNWVLSRGLVRYELVYGSLGTIVGLMFWIYLISTITIFCAHLSAVIELKWGKRSTQE
jgi:membrane protein